MTLPRGIRNRNPGNIRLAQFQWQGELKLSNSDKRYDAEFCVFEEIEHGLRALMKLLINYQQKWGLNTIREVINRWAPPNENDTGAYARAVGRQTGLKIDEPLDFTKLEHLVPVAKAIVRHENGHPHNQIGPDYKEKGYTDDWYEDRVYQDAFELAVKGRLVTHTMNKLPEVFINPKPKPWWLRLLDKLKGK